MNLFIISIIAYILTELKEEVYINIWVCIDKKKHGKGPYLHEKQVVTDTHIYIYIYILLMWVFELVCAYIN